MGARSRLWWDDYSQNNGYTVESGEILVVLIGTTTIQLGDDQTILVAGGYGPGTSTDPVLLESILGNHDGIVFNSSSGLGSN